MRAVGFATLSVGALLWLSGSAQAVVLGADVKAFSDSAQYCMTAPHCTMVQTTLPDRMTKAPFSGRITRWRVQEPIGTLWIQVLRRLPDGRFKAVRSSEAETPISPAENEVFAFDTNLRIRKGQFVGIGLEDFGSSGLNAKSSGPEACRKGLVPGLFDGESGEPNPSYGGCGSLLLYNATLKG